MDQHNEEYKWMVRQLMDWYHHLDLSFEQGEKLYRHEKTEFKFTTVWEEIERDRSFMASILDERQFQLYLLDVERRVNSEKESISQQEEVSVQQIACLQEQLKLILDEYLPPMRAFRQSFDKVFSLADRQKVADIREKYEQAVTERRVQMEAELLKHYRRADTKAAEEENLRIDIDRLVPIPELFSASAGYASSLLELEELIDKYSDELDTWLKKTFATERNYWDKHHQLLNEHFNLDNSPWVITVESRQDEADFGRRFSFLMLKEEDRADTSE